MDTLNSTEDDQKQPRRRGRPPAASKQQVRRTAAAPQRAQPRRRAAPGGGYYVDGSEDEAMEEEDGGSSSGAEEGAPSGDDVAADRPRRGRQPKQQPEAAAPVKRGRPRAASKVPGPAAAPDVTQLLPAALDEEMLRATWLRLPVKNRTGKDALMQGYRRQYPRWRLLLRCGTREGRRRRPARVCAAARGAAAAGRALAHSCCGFPTAQSAPNAPTYAPPTRRPGPPKAALQSVVPRLRLQAQPPRGLRIGGPDRRRRPHRARPPAWGDRQGGAGRGRGRARPQARPRRGPRRVAGCGAGGAGSAAAVHPDPQHRRAGWVPVRAGGLPAQLGARTRPGRCTDGFAGLRGRGAPCGCCPALARPLTAPRLTHRCPCHARCCQACARQRSSCGWGASRNAPTCTSSRRQTTSMQPSCGTRARRFASGKAGPTRSCSVWPRVVPGEAVKFAFL
jgi:hypothetical protein